MNLSDLAWESGCCARTAQFVSGGSVVLVTHTYEPDDYRIEVYPAAGGPAVDEKHHLTELDAQAALAAISA